MPVTHPPRFPALLLASALLLAACGEDASPRSSGAPSGRAVVLDNCGQRVEIAAPPERAVSLNQGTTEIMLALGLADRMAGTGTWTDPVMKGLEKAEARVPRLADNAPSFEKVLAAEPDFVAASFASTFAKGGVAPRGKFRELGVPTYLSPADCAGKDNSGDGDGARTEPLTLDTVYGEVRDLARVFGAEERGERLVRDLRARMDRATEGIDADGT